METEFRPNVEKDMVKFQIGANAGVLSVAVLILTSDRNSVNAGYTTMPEFAKFERVIDELRPVYPLLVLGFRGEYYQKRPHRGTHDASAAVLPSM